MIKTSFIIFCLIFSNFLLSQEKTKVDIKNADFTYINNEKHPDYWRLLGNVNIFHNKTNMYCDSAHYYSQNEKIIAYSNVKIVKDKNLNLYGEKLNYDGENNIAIISKNVVLINNESQLTTNKLEFNLEEEKIQYNSRSRIINNNQDIQSNKGIYLLNKKTYYFLDSVILKTENYTLNTDNLISNEETNANQLNGPSFIFFNDKTIYCEEGYLYTNSAEFFKNPYIASSDFTVKADSIYYYNNKNTVNTHGNVVLTDTINNFIIKGGQADFFEDKDRMVFQKNPSLQLISNLDTLFITSEIFENYQTKGDNKLLSYNNVKFNNENLIGTCDSLMYRTKDSTITLFKKPIIWLDEYQVFSDTILINYFDKKINKLYLFSRPMIISQHDSLNFNQIKGKKMVGHFSENKLSNIEINGNGQSIYYLSEKDETIAMNYLESSNINLVFKERKIYNINYEIIPHSLTTPIKDVKEKDKFLKDFKWRISEKPFKK